jgi:hypothetical protein
VDAGEGDGEGDGDGDVVVTDGDGASDGKEASGLAEVVRGRAAGRHALVITASAATIGRNAVRRCIAGL